MSKVYIVQKQMRFDHTLQELVERFDTAPAEEFGDVVFLLSPSAAPFNPESIIKELSEKLSMFTPDDYLLLVGNPILIGLASAIAADVAGTVNFLQWSGKEQGYLAVTAEVFTNES